MKSDISEQHQQHSLGWFRDRLGKITGSKAALIFAKGRSKEDIFSKTAKSYLASVAAERMLPPYIVDDDENFSAYLEEVNTSTKAMRIGAEREAEARDLYTAVTGLSPLECGCIPHDTIDGFASSPDGIIIAKSGKLAGCLEIKCPKPSTFLEYLSGVYTPAQLKAYNPDYYWQCMSHMAVTGAGWCDFIVYCPYISNPLHIVRISRDEEEIRALSLRMEEALEYVETIVSKAENHG